MRRDPEGRVTPITPAVVPVPRPRPFRPTPIEHHHHSTMPPQEYVRREIANPRPNPAEDLRVLGFQAASELANSRARLRAHILALNEPKLQQGPKVIQPMPVKPIEQRDYAFDTALHRASERPGGLGAIVDRQSPWVERLFNWLPSTAKALHGQGTAANPWIPLEVAGVLGFGPLRAARAGVEAVRAARAVEEGSRVAGAARGVGTSLREGKGVLGPAFRKARLRPFTVGGHTVEIPAAGSRPGQIIERVADRWRNQIPLLKSTEAKAGREMGYSVEHVQAGTKNTYANALKQAARHLTAPQEYALRIVAEGVAPEQRIEAHNLWAHEATRQDQVYYHALHADMTQKASKYIRLVHMPQRGLVPVLADTAPAKLKRSWDIFQRAGDMREGLIRDMGLLSDETMAARVHAPGRIFHGARWQTFETQVANALEGSTTRKALFSAIDKVASSPRAAQNDKVLWDSAVRAAAARAKLPPDQLPGAIEGLYARLTHVETGSTFENIPGAALRQGPERAAFLVKETGDAINALPPREKVTLVGAFRFYREHGEENQLEVAVTSIIDRMEAADQNVPVALKNLQDELRLPQSVKNEYPTPGSVWDESKLHPGDNQTLYQEQKLYGGPAWGGSSPGRHPARDFPFKSALEETIHGLPDKVSPPELLARLKKNGVKDEEIKWTQFDKFVESAGKSVSREEALAWFDSHYLSLEENVRSKMPHVGIHQGEINHPGSSVTKFSNYSLEGGMNANYHELTIRLPKSEHGVQFEYGGHFPDPNILAHVRFTDRTVDGEKTLFIEEIQSDWHQAGQKQGYREPLEAQPEWQAAKREVEDATEELRKISHEIDYHGPTNPQDIRKLIQEMQGVRSYQGWQFDSRLNPAWGHPWRSEVIALAPRYGSEWKPVALYDDEHAASEKAAQWQAWSKQTDAETTARQNELDKLASAYERRHAVTVHFSNLQARLNQGVADAPFKKTWHELAFKRMLAWAVDKGYHRVAWTTGEQQATRYDLANFFSRIKVTPASDGDAYQNALNDAWDGFLESGQMHDYYPPYPDEADHVYNGEFDKESYDAALQEYQQEIESIDEHVWENFAGDFHNNWNHDQGELQLEAWKKGDPVDGAPSSSETIDESDLEDYIGKDLAARVHNGEHTFEGDTLAMGEHAQSAYGASGFYDKKLVGFANKYLKKFKVGVETRKIETPERFTDLRVQRAEGPPYDYFVYDGQDRIIAGPFHGDAVGEAQASRTAKELKGHAPPHGEQVHSIEITPEVEKFVRAGQALYQRGGSLEKVGPYGIKGAISIDSKAGQAALHLTEAADDTTIAHELGHFMRAFLTEDVKWKPVLKWLGVKDGQWDRPAEEKFARSLEHVIRTGDGPQPIKEALRGLSPIFRDVYAQADLPDVPPHVARFIQRLFDFKKKPGGSLVGADDIAVGVEYAPTVRGVPIQMTRPGRAVAAYLRRAGSGGAQLFSGGQAGRAIGGGPADQALKHEMTGSLLRSGFWNFDVTDPKIASSLLATKMSLAHIARKALVEAGHDLPQSPFDFAVKVDPTKNVSKSLKAAWDKINSLQAGTGDETLLEGTTNDLLNEALHSVVPNEINGRRVEDVAAEIMQTQRPVDNIVWVHPDFLEHSGLLQVPGAKKANTETLRKIGHKAMFGVDALTDIQKALVLYLNPAYVPMQFIGNASMNLLQQGVFMPMNIHRAVILHRELAPEWRVFMDTKAGTGAATALPFNTGSGKVFSATLGHWANVAADLLPRRLAFIHEARKWDIHTASDFETLFKGALADDPEAVAKVDAITRSAKRAIVDFDRMSKFEREVLTRFIWFYPWLRGATDYTVHFIADHPVQSIALALAYEHLKVAQQQQLGSVPYFAGLDAPISTQSLGLKVPGTGIDVGLDQAVGKHGLNYNGAPQVFSLRQMLTQTTPLELLQSSIAFAGSGNTDAAADIAQHLTPIPYAAGVATFGYDPFRRQQVTPGLATFFGQMSPTDSPFFQRYVALNMSPAERAAKNQKVLHPRSKGMEWERLLGGSLAPSGYNKDRAQQLALKNAPLLARRTAELKLGAVHFHMPPPDKRVLDELEWMTKLDHAIHNGQTWLERATEAAAIYDEKNGASLSRLVKHIRTEGQAERYYSLIRARIAPSYALYQRQLDLRKRLETSRTPVPATG